MAGDFPFIEISANVGDKKLGEIYQSMGNKMALLRKEGDKYIRITPYVLCRDFLVDVFSFSKVGKAFGIYKMKFDPTVERLPEDVHLLVQFPSKEAKDFFFKNLGFLHGIELANNYVVTDPIQCKEDLEVILEADKRWLDSCLSWSLYTSLVRIFCYEIGAEGSWIDFFLTKHEDSTDAQLLKSVDRETLDRILADLKLLKMKQWCGFDPLKIHVGTIHHNSGFYSVFGTHREIDPSSVQQNQHWQYFRDAGFKLHTS